MCHRMPSTQLLVLYNKIDRTVFMLKKNIFIMYAIAFLQGLVFYSSIATLYRQASGVSVFQITIIESISLVLCLIFELPWGVLADKILLECQYDSELYTASHVF